jgi:UDPglucose--hexose-1-phosphate uridylyltransferase
MIEWESEHKKRVVWEDDDFILFCPFASRANFEMWLIPKKHKPYFERITQTEKISAGTALHEAIKRLSEKLNNPDFNFYIHTSPCDGKDYPHFHWHIEILPKTNIWAGFEISTGVEIITISPEDAAEFLRS